MSFSWDPKKDEANRRKHGVSFQEAAELLRGDSDYLEIYDEEHSHNEDRFIAIGPIRRGVIVVVFTERDDDVVRIISARMAAAAERRRFEESKRGRDGRRDS